MFGAEEEVLYCQESGHSKQNRCLVAGKELRAGGSTAADYRAFFVLLERCVRRPARPVACGATCWRLSGGGGRGAGGLRRSERCCRWTCECAAW